MQSISFARMGLFIAAMSVVVVASNILVQFPVQARLGELDFADFLTWGAFTYPAAFLVNDLTNRRFGPAAARRVVIVGFVLAVIMSIFLATPRIAIASGSAFLVAQMLDVVVFNRLRQRIWWQAPLVSSMIGAVVDTILFFSIAFAPAFGFIDATFGMDNGSLGSTVPFLGVGGPSPHWMSLAAGDFSVKMLVSLAMLVPYGFLLRLILPVRPVAS